MEWKLATEGFTVAEDEHIEGGTIVYEGPYGVKAPAGMRHAYRAGDVHTPCGKPVDVLWTEWDRPFQVEPTNNYCDACAKAVTAG